MTPDSLQWLAVGMAIVSEDIRARLEIDGFSGNAAAIVGLLKQGKWNANGSDALRQCGVHRFNGEKIAESVVATVAEEALCRTDAMAAYVARSARKGKSAQ